MNSCAVFVCTDPKDAVVAARFALGGNGNGYFQYDKSYLGRKDAFALDPKHLPLSNDQLVIPRVGDGLFGALTEAGPDSWGIKIASLLCKQHDHPLPANAVEWLLLAAHNGTGCLAFTKDPSIPPLISSALQKASKLDQRLLQLTADIAANKKIQLDEEAVRLIQPGTNLGGARPKTVVLHEGEEYIAKFSRADDLFNVPTAEYATMRLAHLAGINVPDFELVNLGNNPVFLVKRFDRTPEGYRKHYISAKTMLNINTISADKREYKTCYSYAGIAESVRGFSDRAFDDGHELFRRMVFNIAVGNVDDHLRNHGFLLESCNDKYALSPAFDLVPHPDAPNLPQSIGVGSYGAASTMENALSQCGRFFLKEKEAQDIIAQVKTVVSTWKTVFREAGMSDTDIYRVQNSFSVGLEADRVSVSLNLEEGPATKQSKP